MSELGFVTFPGTSFDLGLTAARAEELLEAGTPFGLTPERLVDETPAHKVSIGAFDLAVAPVTNADYAPFLSHYGDLTLFRSAIADVGARVKDLFATFIDESGKLGPASWKDGTFAPGTEQHPVHGISFYEADAFAKFMSARLPSEEEWELAACGKDGRLFPWGRIVTSPNTANFVGLRLDRTTPVGTYPLGQSPEGLLDLGGNVHEWTTSKYAAYPSGNARYRFGGDDTARVLRGGSFSSDLWDLRGTSRFGVNAKNRFLGLGLRLAKNA